LNLLGEGTAIRRTTAFAIFLAGLAVIGLAVVGLLALLAPDRTASTEAEGNEGTFRSQPQGGELEVTGDRQGTFALTGNAQGPGYGLGGDDGGIFFQGSGPGLSVVQLSYDGLDFFLDADDCILTAGEADSGGDRGSATIECVEIRDVRDTATISVRGRVVLPADLMAERDDLPEVGGTVTVGTETLIIDDGLFRLADAADKSPDAVNRWMSGPRIHVSFRQELGNDYVDQIDIEGVVSEIPQDACEVEREHAAMMDTSTNLVEVSFRCEEVEIGGIGELPIVGSAIVEQVVANS